MTAIMSQLTVQNLQSGVLMDGIASSLASKKYLRRCLAQAISNNENLSPILKKNFEHRFYRELKVKFSGWRCLESLDLTGMITFCLLTYDRVNLQVMKQEV